MTRSSSLCFIVVTLLALGLATALPAEKEDAIYELKGKNISMKFTNWGASVMSLVLPDKYGNLVDIVLGYSSANDYKNNTSNFGSLVGRVANRIGNAQFVLDGHLYKLIANDGNNTLHGGTRGFGKYPWNVSCYKREGHTPQIVFSLRSGDGDQGFPGTVVASVNYSLIADNQLSVEMKAMTLDKATPVNLAQHTYWNLAGHDKGNILSEKVQIFASHYTPVNRDLIPTGEIKPVNGTPYDFLEPQLVGSRIGELTNGYDINYALDRVGTAKSRRRVRVPKTSIPKMKKAAVVYEERTGIQMTLWTNQPGVQFYTGNFLNGKKGKDGAVYQQHAGLCLETQGFPDAVNHPNFPSQILRPGQTYRHSMLFQFDHM